jgi:hypothetical protein
VIKDSAKTSDTIAAGVATSSPACDEVMRGVDNAARLVLAAGAIGAVAQGATSTAELVGRFRRALIVAGLPK